MDFKEGLLDGVGDMDKIFRGKAEVILQAL
jgi:hypothetical protein